MLAVLPALCVAVPAGLGWLGERRRLGPGGRVGQCCDDARSVRSAVLGTPHKRRIVRAAGIVGSFSVSLGLLALLVPPSAAVICCHCTMSSAA